MNSELASVARAITAQAVPGRDAAGGHVESLTESVMGVTAGLMAIASALDRLADVAERLADEQEIDE